jgi:electron transfer flavoprotein alpha subunit
MPVLVYAENIEGKFHKPLFEALSYGAETAKLLGTNVIAVSIGNVADDELKKLSQYGAAKILSVKNDKLNDFNVGAYTNVLQQAAQKESAEVIILSSTFNGKALAPRLSAKMKAGLVPNAVHLPETGSGFIIKKPVFSGKGFGYFRINTPVKIITVAINSFHLVTSETQAGIEGFEPQLSDTDFPVKVTDTKRAKGKISLPEAEIVVSGGRGMKGPENWGMIEELADILGAATACSKPVADIHWRPHAEHVGQTGLTISPDLYIAIGISGAIQHLAGVSSSKVIVAINKDAEAPFFKAADYGIIGDAFEVLPKLIEAAKHLKAS